MGLLASSFEQSQLEACKGGVSADVGSKERQQEAWNRGRGPRVQRQLGTLCSPPSSQNPCQPILRALGPRKGGTDHHFVRKQQGGAGEAVWEQGPWLQTSGECPRAMALWRGGFRKPRPGPFPARRGEEACGSCHFLLAALVYCFFLSLIQLKPHDSIEGSSEPLGAQPPNTLQ